MVGLFTISVESPGSHVIKVMSSAVWATPLCWEMSLLPLRKEDPSRSHEVPGIVQGAAAACQGWGGMSDFLSKAVRRQTKHRAIVVTSSSATISSPRTNLVEPERRENYSLHLSRDSYSGLTAVHPSMSS